MMSDSQNLATRIRRVTLQASARAGVGHIGSNLCVAEILATLYTGVLRRGDDRDRLILSKGHAGLALYATLNAVGEISDEELDAFCTDGGSLGVHPHVDTRGVDFSTGSLGQGLSMGVGAALAARLDGSVRRTFVLMSDAECNEGSTWEAAMFAAHHSLGNLIAVIDANGQQALGYTRDVLDLSNLSERWSTFGWAATDVDGHDSAALGEALSAHGDRPLVVVGHTTFGKGVSFMESSIDWHYLPMSPSEYSAALEQVGPAGS